MVRQNYTAVVERNRVWEGDFASEPYECGWASEAIFFVRKLQVQGLPPFGVRAGVQISPDGMRWCDEGTDFYLTPGEDRVDFVRVRHFGNWLRIAGTLPEGAQARVIVYLTLKE